MTNSLTAVNLLVIRSPDIHRSVVFYEQLGVVFKLHSHGNGPEHYTSDTGTFVFEIYPQRNPNDGTTNIRLGFSVTDVDTVVERVLELGAATKSKPSNTEWGRQAVIDDLDGHTVELIAPPKS